MSSRGCQARSVPAAEEHLAASASPCPLGAALPAGRAALRGAALASPWPRSILPERHQGEKRALAAGPVIGVSPEARWVPKAGV